MHINSSWLPAWYGWIIVDMDEWSSWFGGGEGGDADLNGRGGEGEEPQWEGGEEPRHHAGGGGGGCWAPRLFNIHLSSPTVRAAMGPGPGVTLRSASGPRRSEQSDFVKAEDWKETIWNIEEVEATAWLKGDTYCLSNDPAVWTCKQSVSCLFVAKQRIENKPRMH